MVDLTRSISDLIFFGSIFLALIIGTLIGYFLNKKPTKVENGKMKNKS